MTIRKRAFLIFIGLLVFIIGAPSLIFYARGFRYDFDNNRIIKTGTLIVKSVPKNAEVKLDGASLGITPLTKRFILPGEYALEIKKLGYHTWKKLININAQEVTYLPRDIDKLALFLENPKEMILSTSTVDFALEQENIFSLNPGKQSAWEIWLNNFEKPKHILVATSSTAFIDLKIQAVRLLDDTNAELLINTNNGLWHISQGTTLVPKDLSNVEFASQKNTILGIDGNNNLVSINLTNSLREILIPQILAYARLDETLYVINKQNMLVRFQADDLEKIDVLTSLPTFLTGQIIVTPVKKHFLLLDKNLYAINADSKLEQLNQEIDFASWDMPSESLFYGNEKAYWVYHPLGMPSSGIINSKENRLGFSRYNSFTGYVFSSNQEKIIATEFGTRGKPNVFDILETNSEYVRFSVDQKGTKIAVLDGQILKIITIR